MKNEVNKTNAELFEALFGSEMKSNEVKLKEQQAQQMKPYPVIVIEDLFAILKRIFTSIIPFAMMLIKALNYDNSENLYKYIVLSGLKITLYAVCAYAALTVLDFIITIIVGNIYMVINNRKMKQMAFLQSKIKSKLKKQDEKDKSEGIKEFSEEELEVINKAKQLSKDYEEKVKKEQIKSDKTTS